MTGVTTLVHITATPYPALGYTMLRVDTSGDPAPGDVVQLARRESGAEVSTPLIVPAGYVDSGDAAVHLVNGSGVFADTTTPLDTAVEYLGALPGGGLVVSGDPVTLDSDGVWRLGDPLRPYLDLSLALTSSATTQCPLSVQGRIVMVVDSDTADMQSDVQPRPGSATPSLSLEPLASPTYGIRFGTRTQADREAAEALFAPGGVLLLRSPSDYQADPRFVLPTNVQVARIRSDHRSQWRVITAQLKVVDQPVGGAYGWLGARWADQCSVYATWADLEADELSWVSMALGISGGGFPSSMTTMAELTATGASYADLIAAGYTYQQIIVGG